MAPPQETAPPSAPGGSGRSNAGAAWAGLVIILAVVIFALMNSRGFISQFPEATNAGPSQATETLTLPPPPTPIILELLNLVYQSSNGGLSIHYPAGWAVSDEASNGPDSARVSFASIKLESSVSRIPDNFVSIMITMDSTESIKSNLLTPAEFTPAGILSYVRDQPGGLFGNATPTPENYRILQDVQEMTLSGYPAASLIIETLDKNLAVPQNVIIDLAFIMTDYNQAAAIYTIASETGWEVNKVVLDRMLASLILKPGTMPAPTAGPQEAPTTVVTLPPPPAEAAPTPLDTPPPE